MNRVSAGKRFAPGGIVQPVSDDSDAGFLIVAVRFDVLAADIRDKLLVPVALTVHDQAAFITLCVMAVAFCSEEKAEFQGHIEAGEFVLV